MVMQTYNNAESNGRVVCGFCLRPFAWGRGFLSLVSVVRFQLEVSYRLWYFWIWYRKFIAEKTLANKSFQAVEKMITALSHEVVT